MRGDRVAGRWLIAATAAGFGALVVAFHDLAPVWPTAAKSAPPALTWIAAALLVAIGLGLIARRAATIAAAALVLYLVALIAVARLPPLLHGPKVELNWYGVGETLCWASGAVALLAQSTGRTLLARVARYAFGLSLLPIGLSHFFYQGVTAGLIPRWLPGRPEWAMATGAAHLAAGVAVLAGVVPRLAATLEAVMMSLFTLIVWIPAVIHAPHEKDAWSELAISAALSGAAWAVACLLADRKIAASPWRSRGESLP